LSSFLSNALRALDGLTTIRNILFEVGFTHYKKISTCLHNEEEQNMKSCTAGATTAPVVKLQLPMLTNQASYFYWKVKAGRCYDD